MSNFVVSARKYRPHRFEDVVGQEHVTQTLKNALQNDHLAHAFLFCGPRGVGKTTCARILAKVLNCQNVTSDFEPCDTCPSCKAFNENASFNITELDAASNNSVEHIRTLIEQVRFQPQQGKYKVFIIDEVHMLSQQAFNAFLKTLEEPPSYAIFILATTEKHKIIPTILSRCQIFDFRRIQIPNMVLQLQEICTEEGIVAEEDALHIIAQKADGALRDALSIFDRIVSFSSKQIRYEDVITNLNVLDYDYYFQLVDAFLTENAAAVMNLFDRILYHGFEPDIFLAGLAEHIRNLMVCKDKETLRLLEVSETLKERYQQQAALTPTSLLMTTLNLVNEADIHYKMARNKRLHVEITLMKMTYAHRAIQMPNLPATSKEMVEEKKNLIPDEPSSLSASVVEEPELRFEKPILEIERPQSLIADDKAHPINGLRKLGKHNMMPLVPKLDELEEAVKLATQVKEVAPTTPLTVEKIINTWKNYAEEVGKGSIRSILNTTELVVNAEAHHIVAKVTSGLSKSLIQQETGLLERLRVVFQRPQLIFEVEIDESKQIQETQKPRPLTTKEKYANMLEVNPLIEELVSRFDMILDE